jgi:hypothetical protein
MTPSAGWLSVSTSEKKIKRLTSFPVARSDGNETAIGTAAFALQLELLKLSADYLRRKR